MRYWSSRHLFEKLAKPQNNAVFKINQRNLSNTGEWSDDEVRKMRLMKRVGAGLLFSATLGLAIYSKRNKAQKLRDCLEDCERLPPDPDYTTSMGSDFYRCKSCIFPGDIVKSGTLKKLESLELKNNDVIVASFPKSGMFINMFSVNIFIIFCVDKNMNRNNMDARNCLLDSNWIGF